MQSNPRKALKIAGLYAALFIAAVVSYMLYLQPARVERALAELEASQGTFIYGGGGTFQEARLRKRAACDALVRMKATYVRGKLLDMLAAPDVLTRKYAARALGYLGEPSDDEALIRAVQGSLKERDTREALGGSIWDAVADPQREARGEALIALARLNTDRAFQFVRQTMESDKAMAPYGALAMWVSPREGTDEIALSKIMIGSRERFDDSAYEYILEEKALEFVPLLIEVLSRHPAPDCNIANEVLEDVTGAQAPLAFPEAPLPKDAAEYREPPPTPESRRQAVEKWRQWWEVNKSRAAPLRRQPRRSYDISPAKRSGPG